MTNITEIENELKAFHHYPKEAYVWKKGLAVYEFPFIVKANSFLRYKVCIQRHYATDPFTLAEKRTWRFFLLKNAIRKYNDLL